VGQLLGVHARKNGRAFDKLADDLRGGLATYRGHPAALGDMMQWVPESHKASIDTAYDHVSTGDDLAGVYILGTHCQWCRISF
jgi:hypothetical protein